MTNSSKMRIKPQRIDDKLLDPRFCTYKLSGKIRGRVEKLIESEDIEELTRNKLKTVMDEDEANKSTLSYESLATLHQYLQRADEDYAETPFWIFKDQCKCIKPKPRENKQLEARLQQLRLRDSQSLYNQAAYDVDKRIENEMLQSNQPNASSVGEELRMFNGSFVAVINSFLVYICTFIFCYKALEYALMEPNIIGQVLFGLFGSTIVAVAELYFLARVI